MSNFYHLKALLKKNFILMKRNYFVTICEIFAPMILMLLLYALRIAFKIEYTMGEDEDIDKYIIFNSTAMISNQTSLLGIPYKGTFSACKIRFYISLIGKNFPQKLIDKLEKKKNEEKPMINFNYFETINDLESYIQSSNYGSDIEKYPEICFGIYFNHDEEYDKYDISLHYFSSFSETYPNDVPSTLVPNLDIFLKSPDFQSNKRYIDSGYLNVMKLIYDYILVEETGNDNAKIDMIVMSKMYNIFIQDKFNFVMGYMLGFFLIITYAIPLTRYIFILVKEKETKSKEGMKIMGLTETDYFLSYFIQYFLLNIIYSHIPWIYVFLLFFLFGLNVFSLVYFFQSFLDKTRLAMIVSILIYFLMYFLSTSFSGVGIKHWVRVLMSIIPPISLQLGLNVMARFENKQKECKLSDITLRFYDYCIRDMLIMLSIDIFIYLFLGFYLQNIVTHDFGMSRPWYFLCTKSYWGCGKKKKKIIKK